MFAKALCDKSFTIKCKDAKEDYLNYCEQLRQPKQATADYPYSLMNGLAGETLFLLDLVMSETKVRFPGFEV